MLLMSGSLIAQERRGHDSFENGDVIVSETARVQDSDLKRSTSAYQETVVGVFNETSFGRKVPTIATEGIALVKFDGSNGQVKKGDWVTTSSTSGTAMKATESGMVLGIALENSSDNELLKIRILIFWRN